MFRTLLIANRGEIACRVIRTARRMGIATIAVYSDADAGAVHVGMADRAVHIGGAEARASYLRGDAIIKAAKDMGADAIHPGYGFLSENAAFAEACAKAGIIFVGPPPDAIRAMGLKDAAKALMAKSGVPVVPGYHGENQDAGFLAGEAGKIGYPVLIKAVAGGGGKGMRRVDAPEAFAAALQSCKREAASSFGDDRVLIEKYITRPRHIEIQVFADSHGNAIHLFERDCSVQRRHQKVLEEAPAPGMPEAMRSLMGAAAVKAAAAIAYQGAGTVEFIADASDGLKPDRFWFMEMNTRLQVEHPVTEMITGLDLVEWQLRVAAGEKLPLSQDAITKKGHAIEARLYAEDPVKGFLPSIGTLHRLRLPENMAHVRIDGGVREGDAVSMFYDPMIAKVIAWGETRARALARLSRAMRQVEIAGVRTNAAFIDAALHHRDFAAGDVDTGFIDRNLAALMPPEPALPADAAILAALFVVHERQAATPRGTSPWDIADGFRVGGISTETLALEHAGKALPVIITRAKGVMRAAAAGREVDVSADITSDGTIAAVLGGVRLKAAATRIGHDIVVMQSGAAFHFVLPDALSMDDTGSTGADRILAPMPGKIIQVMAEKGAKVSRGMPLVTLEAMKMEHTLTAPADGVIAEVLAAVGAQVTEGALLVRLEAA